MSLLNLDRRESLQVSESSTPRVAEHDQDEDSLERYKRIQCEKVIEEVQGKLLQVQQDLAVAMAHNHKKEKQVKDLNQLLDRVGESWRKMEIDSKRYFSEKEVLGIKVNTLSQECKQLKERVDELESHNKELLRKAQQARERHEAQDLEAERQLVHLQKELSQEKEISRIAQDELTSARMSLQEAQREKAAREDTWQLQLTRWQQESAAMRSELQDLGKEKVALQGQVTSLLARAEETEKQTQDLEREKEKLETELRRQGADAALCELESQANFKQQVADLNCEWEDRLKVLKESHQRELKDKEESAREKHQKELRTVRDELSSTIQRLEAATCETETWRNRAERLQIGRSQILSRLQSHLREQWSEAVRLLYENPEESDPNDKPTSTPRTTMKQDAFDGSTPFDVGCSSTESPTLPTVIPQNDSIPERDTSSNVSRESYSPLQHYIHLLLKQPPRQQTVVSSPTLSPTSQSSQENKSTPKSSTSIVSPLPPWK